MTYKCAECDEELRPGRVASLKKDLEDKKPWSLPVDCWCCVPCQEQRDEDGKGLHVWPTEALAEGGEGDNATRDREMGWGPIKRRLVVMEKLIA